MAAYILDEKNPMAEVHDENHAKNKGGVFSDDFGLRMTRHSEKNLGQKKGIPLGA